MGRFVGEREDHLRVSVRSVEGCGSNVYIYTSNSGDKTPKISLSRGVVLSQSTFHLVTTDN